MIPQNKIYYPTLVPSKGAVVKEAGPKEEVAKEVTVSGAQEAALNLASVEMANVGQAAQEKEIAEQFLEGNDSEMTDVGNSAVNIDNTANVKKVAQRRKSSDV